MQKLEPIIYEPINNKLMVYLSKSIFKTCFCPSQMYCNDVSTHFTCHHIQFTSSSMSFIPRLRFKFKCAKTKDCLTCSKLNAETLTQLGETLHLIHREKMSLKHHTTKISHNNIISHEFFVLILLILFM